MYFLHLKITEYFHHSFILFKTLKVSFKQDPEIASIVDDTQNAKMKDIKGIYT